MKVIVIKYSLFLVVFSLFFNSYAQQGQIEYLFDMPQNKYVYTPILQFNQTKSIFIYNRTDIDSPTAKGTTTRADGNMLLTITSGDQLGDQNYTDFKEKNVIFRVSYSKIIDAYITVDDWVDIQWDIKKDTKKIGNYNATKAVGNFRGRTYTVWFTYEIPLPIGPWKLKGLPGAILEAVDSEKEFVVKFVSAKYPCDCADLLAIPEAEKQLTIAEHVYFLDNIDAFLLKKLSSKMPRESKFTFRRVERSQKEKRKQLPERIYEWETEK